MNSRKRTREKKTYNPIPCEILFKEIMPRLPVKSLLKFRSVSTQFRDEIDSSEFALIQHAHSWSRVHTCTNQLLDFYGICPKTIFLSSLNINEQNLRHRSRISFSGADGYQVVGFQKGLLCVTYCGGRKFILFNMATRKHYALPVLDPNLTKLESSNNMVGLGYDSVNDDVKVVRIFVTHPRQVKLMVYSLKANAWKMIDAEFPHQDARGFKWLTMVSGSLHYMAYIWDATISDNKLVVAGFDLDVETYKEVPMPHALVQEIGYNFEIGEFGGNLCILNGVDECCFWEMKEYGVQESWTVLFRINGSMFGVPPRTRFDLKLCFSGGDELLLKLLIKHKRKVRVRQLVWLNTKTMCMRLVQVMNENSFKFLQQSYVAVDSLTPLPICGSNKGDDQDHISSSSGKSRECQFCGDEKLI